MTDSAHVRRAAIAAAFSARTWACAPSPSLFCLATLAGCAGGGGASSLFYFPPYQIDDLECPEINKRLADANTAPRKVATLRQRAEATAAGSVLGAIAYGPEHSKAVFDQQAYRDAAARKNCPPPTSATPAPRLQPVPPGAARSALPPGMR